MTYENELMSAGTWNGGVEGFTFLTGIDESADYETDITEIWRAPDGQLVLATASGCSCWSGEWEQSTYATVDELKAGLNGDGREYGLVSRDTADRLLIAAGLMTANAKPEENVE